ncbi:MAG: hypothetical protein JWR19_1227 [Pedosphaera sp.]|nr:hypothetical protein [Pedosphaera sp.]
MKLIKANKERLSFQIDKKEKRALFSLLKLYPLMPAGYQRLSRSEAKSEDQELLDEALTTQRLENKRQVLAMMKAKSRFRVNKNGYRFSIKPAQLEWLLQVLNDIRLGSWLSLGSPDGAVEMFAALSEQNAPYFWAMDMAGQFQMILLHALTGEGSTQADSPPSTSREH